MDEEFNTRRVRDTSAERERAIRATAARDDGTSLGVDQGRDLLAMLDEARAALAALREAAEVADEECERHEPGLRMLRRALADTAPAAEAYRAGVRAEVLRGARPVFDAAMEAWEDQQTMADPGAISAVRAAWDEIERSR